ncbi:MAG: DUF952 domain-containing protein [Phycisphaerales bacterium]|nr:DUF952 domain-containing protein [Phycisphaerales bacterium]
MQKQPSNEPILHIISRDDWERARIGTDYRGDTLDTEGFIHCSTRDQIAKTANRFYPGRTDLLLLCIDPGRVTAEIRYEPAENHERFPHIYGPLNLEAVERTIAFEPDQDGLFSTPPQLGEFFQ